MLVFCDRTSIQGGDLVEEKTLHRDPDCLCPAPSREWFAGCGDNSPAGDLGGHFFRWKKKFTGLEVAEIRWLKQLVADLTLDRQMLQEVLSQKL